MQDNSAHPDLWSARGGRPVSGGFGKPKQISVQVSNITSTTIVNCTTGNKLQWNMNQTMPIVI